MPSSPSSDCPCIDPEQDTADGWGHRAPGPKRISTALSSSPRVSLGGRRAAAGGACCSHRCLEYAISDTRVCSDSSVIGYKTPLQCTVNSNGLSKSASSKLENPLRVGGGRHFDHDGGAESALRTIGIWILGGNRGYQQAGRSQIELWTSRARCRRLSPSYPATEQAAGFPLATVSLNCL